MELQDMPIGRLLAMVHRHLELARRRGLRAIHVTPRQYGLLKALHEEGSLCHRQMARMLDMDPAALSRMVRQMEARGWVRRERSDQDQRSWLLVLEPGGQEVLARGQAVFRSVGQQALQGLTEADQETLRELLIRWLKSLPSVETGR
ncbi:MAG TPA: MarR family transcriptional regulator [Myxococcota bacterium]|nr:MarR family transcriptional regulator [Myxococcota bacterium]HQK49777.1 MarR family transcriptional regulator [Myxococcota bacterium]